MNLDFTEEQEMLKTSARDFLTNECPKTLVRELEEDEKGYSPDLWKKMAELGWMGLIIPEEYDGMEMQFLDLVILIEEMGRNIVPGPFFATVVLGGQTILIGGSEEQKKELLPKISNGELIMTMAITEPSASYGASGVNLKAQAQGDDYVLSGTKLFVENAHIADLIIVVARTKEGGKAEDGITLFLVDGKSAGLKAEIVPTIADDKLCEVTFNNVKVPKKNIIGAVDKGWPIAVKVREQAALAKCAEMLGGADAVLDMTVAYVKDRVQYGRPIGAFQVIQHFCSNMWISVDTSRNIIYETAWKISEGIPASMEVAAAKGWLNEAYKFVAERGVQCHGAIGTTRDHDMGLYYRRAMAADLAYGDTDFQRELVALQIGL
ncbi:MAG: acyl-CoA dehydrogenase family protein [Chloroflexota bacterium]|nr:acyl-CoA dehydrogenase family protein [Chloroflexota bacterium]